MNKEPEKHEMTTEELDLVSGGLGWNVLINSEGGGGGLKPATGGTKPSGSTNFPGYNILANKPII